MMNTTHGKIIDMVDVNWLDIDINQTGSYRTLSHLAYSKEEVTLLKSQVWIRSCYFHNPDHLFRAMLNLSLMSGSTYLVCAVDNTPALVTIETHMQPEGYCGRTITDAHLLYRIMEMI